jgi:hypothetical protein
MAMMAALHQALVRNRIDILTLIRRVWKSAPLKVPAAEIGGSDYRMISARRDWVTVVTPLFQHCRGAAGRGLE